MEPRIEHETWYVIEVGGKFVNTLYSCTFNNDGSSAMFKDNVADAFRYTSLKFAEADLEQHREEFPGAVIRKLEIRYEVTNL